MLRRILVNCLCIATLLFSVSVNAKEVTIKHNGLKLNALVDLAPGKKLSDGVILITHGGLAHNSMESLVYLRQLLNESGYTTLAINLSLGINNRHGAYNCKTPHRHRDYDTSNEIDAWLNWLNKQGLKQVVLLGHSRGGGQTALHAAERDNDLIKAVVLMAPSTRDNGAAGYQQRYGQPLTPVLDKAQQLVRQGKGDTILEHANIMFCRDVPVSAASFVSYYGPDDRLDTPALLPKIKKPVLVLVAGDDEVVVDLEKKIAPIANSKDLQVNEIESSDHFFRDLFADDAVEVIKGFLVNVARLS
ncbi:MAG: alpha/beta fold hydrolase [Proteobacteria bacterium]|nr:alpha/beta fold hydrolase [Pseudomonadota bacterium]